MKTTANDKNALMTQLYTGHNAKLIHYIASRINDASAAEDLAQDTWLRMLTSKVNIEEQSAASYLYAVARNIINDYLRNQYIKQAASSTITASEHPVYELSTDTHTIVSDLLQKEQERAESMPKQRRMIYTMYRYDDKSTEDIALELSLSQRTVENHLWLARKYVREYMRHIA